MRAAWRGIGRRWSMGMMTLGLLPFGLFVDRVVPAPSVASVEAVTPTTPSRARTGTMTSLGGKLSVGMTTPSEPAVDGCSLAEGAFQINPCRLDVTAGWGRTDTTVVYFQNRDNISALGITPSVICPPSVVPSCSITSASYRVLSPGEHDSILVIYTVKSLFEFSTPNPAVIKVRFTVQIGSGPGPVAGIAEGAVRVRAVMHKAEVDPGLDARVPDLCVAACAEARYAQPLMGYRSLDVARGVTLVYSGATVGPRPFIHTTVTALGEHRWTGTLRLRAMVNGVQTSFVNGDQALHFAGIPAPVSTTSPARRVRLAAQVNASSYATGLYPLTVLVQDNALAGYFFGEDTVTTFLPVVNGQDSPVARGWGVAGVQRRYVAYDTFSERVYVLIVNGDGSYSRFDGEAGWYQGPISYAAPAAGSADISVIYQNFRYYPDGSWVEFDAAGYMIKYRDGKNGLVTQYEYESWSGGMRLKRILDPYRKVGGLSAATVFTYGTNGLTSVAAPGVGGRTTTIAVDGNRRLTGITDPDGQATTFTYDGTTHRLTKVTDRLGGTHRYFYDTLTALLDSVSAPKMDAENNGVVTTMAPTTRFSPWQTVALPRVPTSPTAPAAWVYDTVRPAVVRDPLGQPTNYQVDYWGQPTSVSDALGPLATSGRTRRPFYYIDAPEFSCTSCPDTMWARWVPTPLVSWTFDSVRGQSETEYRFDDGVDWVGGPVNLYPKPRVARTRAPGGSDVYYAYNYLGTMWDYATALDSVWGIGVPTTRYRYNSLAGSGLPDSVSSFTIVSNPLTNAVATVVKTTRFTYAAVHRRLASETDPLGNTTTYSYDPVFGNLTQVVRPGSRTTTKIMDSQGRDSIAKVPGFADVVTTYDLMDRPLTQRVLTTPNLVTTYEYDPLFLRAVVDAKNQRYAMDRDSVGRLIREYTANTTSTYRFYRYNALGQLARRTKRGGQALKMYYDARGRMTHRFSVPDSSVADTFTYIGVRKVIYSNRVARDTVVGDPAQVERFGLTTTTLFATGNWTSYFKVAQSRRSAWTGVDSVTITENTTGPWDTYVNTQYSKANSYFVLPEADGIAIDGNTVLTQYFDQAQRPLYHWGNVARSTRLPYMSGHRPSEVRYDEATAQAVFRRTYGYDSTYRLSQVQQPYQNRHRRYSYDALGRLAQVEFRTQVEGPGCHVWPTNQSDPGFNLHSGWNVTCGAPDSVQTFSYDAVGNRTDQPSLYDPGNRQRQFGVFTFDYDGDGNVRKKVNTATGKTWRYGWDALNRLIWAKVGSDSTSYEYDAQGRLARRQLNGVPDRHWVYVGAHVLAELDGGLHKVRQYVYRRGLDQPLASIEAGSSALNYHVLDEQGNVVGQMTGASGSGTVKQQVEYDPWGKPIVQVASGNRLRWKGLLQDSLSGGLYYMRNRWYDPENGRFLSEDPIGLEGGINLYQFANGDPINLNDPLGLCPVCAAGWALYEVGSTFYDIYDLGRTWYNYRRGQVSGVALGVTAAGVGIGIGSIGGGYGKAARLALTEIDSWGNLATLARHFREHGADFGARTAGEYASMASDFFQRSQRERLPTKIDSDGVIRVFDPVTNTFGSYNPNGTTRTFYKPTSSTYFDRQPGTLQ